MVAELLIDLSTVRVRILRQLMGFVSGVSLRHYQPGQVYDLPPSIADYLVAEGAASFEMRVDEHPQPPGRVERRRRVKR